ncbi:MAG: hypothetical protein ACRED2_03290, partial [Methylocella sp.]
PSWPRPCEHSWRSASFDDCSCTATLPHIALKADIAEVKADILKWVVGAIGFQTVVILGALVSLVRIFAK